MSLKAKKKYSVVIQRGGVDWLRLIPHTFLSLLSNWSVWDTRENIINIIYKKNGIISKKYNYGAHYLNAIAKRKFIEEDLNNFSIEEFEEKYELTDKPMKEKEPKFKIEELN